MVKLIRVTQQQFMVNGNAAHCEQFGAKKQTGSPVPTLDPASIQAGSAFTGDGWLDAVVNANKQPFLEDMNGLFRVAFYQIAQIFQDGIPVWDGGTTYYTGSIVRQDGTSNLFASAIDNNQGNALPPAGTSNGNWTFLNPASVPAGTIFDFAGATTPTGYLTCDGTSYATAAQPNLFAAIGYTWGGSGANFNVPDLRGRAGIGAGAGPGLSTRTLGQTLGEETHILTTPEMPSHSHGVSDPGHTHTVTGDFGASGSGGSALLSTHNNPPSFPTSSKTTGIGINSTGGDGAHNNMQPSAVVKKIIKF